MSARRPALVDLSARVSDIYARGDDIPRDGDWHLLKPQEISTS